MTFWRGWKNIFATQAGLSDEPPTHSKALSGRPLHSGRAPALSGGRNDWPNSFRVESDGDRDGRCSLSNVSYRLRKAGLFGKSVRIVARGPLPAISMPAPDMQPSERLLTKAEFQKLKDVPPEAEWFANIQNENGAGCTKTTSEVLCALSALRRPRSFERSRVLTSSLGARSSRTSLKWQQNPEMPPPQTHKSLASRIGSGPTRGLRAAFFVTQRAGFSMQPGDTWLVAHDASDPGSTPRM